MKIVYHISEQDFVTYQLYVASKSARIKRKRRINTFLIPLIYLFIGLWGFFKDNMLRGGAFLLVAVLWFLIYPYWERRRYRNHYQAFIKENYQHRFGKSTALEFNDEVIWLKDEGSESHIQTTELIEMSEIPTAIYLKLKNGQSLILPKDKIAEIDSLIPSLKALAQHLQIQYCVEDKWEWK